MTEVEKFAKELRKLADKASPALLKMPSNTVGLPEGIFDPKVFLRYIADCLECKVS